MLQKYHTKWTCQNGTFFTAISFAQKLQKNPHGKWLDEMSQNLVDMDHMDRSKPGNIFSHNGARYNTLASQTENLDRKQELLLCSHRSMK